VTSGGSDLQPFLQFVLTSHISMAKWDCEREVEGTVVPPRLID
jgi:hypothetical protein